MVSTATDRADAQESTDDLLEELRFAAQQMRDLPREKKHEMEMLTNFSADAIAHLYDKCTKKIEALRA